MDENSNNNSVNSQPNLSNKEIKELETHEASKKTAHVVGKAAATYFGKEAGAQAYDAISQTKAGQKIEELAGKAMEKSSFGLTNEVMRKANESGILDAANQAVDMIGSKNPGANNMLKGNNANTAKPVNNNFARRNLGNQMQPIVTPPTNIDGSMIPEGVDPEEYLQALNEEQQMMEEMLRQEELAKEKKQKSKERNKKIVEFIKKNPQIMLIIIGILVAVTVIFFVIYMLATDMDIVGTRMTSYSQAKTLGGYCQQIRLIKEHDDYPGDPIYDIDSVNFEETFKLNGKYVKRWEYKDYDLDEYAKHVVQAEAGLVNDEKTYEVASILARTYALQIASKKCYIWDNRNKRGVYKNPQSFHIGPISEDVQSAVTSTSGLVLTLDDKLVDMSNYSYHDYFCFTEKTTEEDDKEHGFYKMLQKNKEEHLLIPVKWAKDIDVNNLKYSGKYNGGIYNNECQENGLSLFGAKYLLNKRIHAYSTIRVLKYYYGYHTEIKRVVSSIASNGCYYWPTTSTRITSQFGLRDAPTAGASTNHGAIDIGVATGSDVYATASGTVTKVYSGCSVGIGDCGGGYGNHIKIDHGGGISSIYAHLSATKVSVGDTVSQGQVIAASGNTGRSTGPHLHFEIRVNGIKVDPLNYVSITDTKPSCNTTTSIGGGNIVSTGDNTKTVCLALLNNGFNTAAVAGIMTNINSESSFNPNAFNSSGGGMGAYGIAQWRAGRQQGLKSLANYQTVEVQIQYLLNEITTGGEKSAGNAYIAAMNSGGNPSDMTYVWCSKYERPGRTSNEVAAACTERKNATVSIANGFYQYAQNGCN